MVLRSPLGLRKWRPQPSLAGTCLTVCSQKLSAAELLASSFIKSIAAPATSRIGAHLGELIDRGVDVHFAHESLDLASRGGRLSADIQAVVAADFIRNLKQEVRKGFYGRLKQGFYPLPAPTGYLDRGGGKAKEIDPRLGPLIRQTFDVYGEGRYSLDELRLEMHRRGLANRAGQAIFQECRQQNPA